MFSVHVDNFSMAASLYRFGSRHGVASSLWGQAHMQIIVMLAESKRMLLRDKLMLRNKLRVYKRTEGTARSRIMLFEAKH